MRKLSRRSSLNFTAVAYLLVALLVVCFLKVIPHLSATSPLLSVALFSACVLSRGQATALLLAANLLADGLLAYVYGYPWFGSWTLFVYSGLLGLAILGGTLRQHYHLTYALALNGLAVIGFWLWTNLGVWLTGTWYTHDMPGFVACYTLALPFLARSIVANVIGTLLLFPCLRTSFRVQPI